MTRVSPIFISREREVMKIFFYWDMKNPEFGFMINTEYIYISVLFLTIEVLW